MKIKPLKAIPIFIAAGVIGLVCLLQTFRLSFFERLEWMTYDWRVREAAGFSTTIATNLGFVYIDDESIVALKGGLLGKSYSLYWPRHVYGRLVRELATQGAKAVAFDVIFGEMSPDHAPVAVLDKTLSDAGELFGRSLTRVEDQVLVESDGFFAWQMKKAGNVIIADSRGVAPHDLFRTNAFATGDISADKDIDGVLRRAKAYREQRRWHPLIAQLASPEYGFNLANARVELKQIVFPRRNGESLRIPIDPDSTFALADFIGEKIPAGTAPRAQAFTTQRIWHMGIVLAAQELKLDLSKAVVDLEHGRIILHGAGGMERIIPVDPNGYFYIDWALRQTDKRLTNQNIAALLEQDRDRLAGGGNNITNLWQNKLVVVGSTATGNDLADLGATPLDKETHLMSKHYNIANSVILGRFVHRSSLVTELLLTVVMGVVVAFLTWGLRPLAASFGVLLLMAAFVVIGALLYVKYRYWMPLVLPCFVVMMMQHIYLVTYRVVFEQDEKRRIKSVFTRIVSPDVVNELLKTEKLSLEGERREISVFFSDVRGFTELTDTLSEQAAEYVLEHNLAGIAAEDYLAQRARETLSTVNLYLGTIVDLVIKHHGTLDKYIGDCVMAFWGAPIPNESHALACVRAAIDAQRAVHELNHQRTAENQRRGNENVARIAAGQPPLPILPILVVGSGINTGVTTVGLMGSDVHGLNYTVFGREVNLASRLESISGRSRIIIGEATYTAVLRDDPKLAAICVALPPEQVKGFRSAVKIYEVPWQMISSTLPVSDSKSSTVSESVPAVGAAERTKA